jgi:hypothetical protein
MKSYRFRKSQIGLLTLSCLLFLALALESPGQTFSVEDDYLIWKTSECRNTQTNKTTVQSGMFKSGIDSIVWVFDNGKMSDALPVISKEGSWLNVSEDGYTVFGVDWKNIAGTVRFQRSNGQTKIIMEFIKDKVNVTPYEFTVSQIEKN